MSTHILDGFRAGQMDHIADEMRRHVAGSGRHDYDRELWKRTKTLELLMGCVDREMGLVSEAERQAATLALSDEIIRAFIFTHARLCGMSAARGTRSTEDRGLFQ